MMRKYASANADVGWALPTVLAHARGARLGISAFLTSLVRSRIAALLVLLAWWAEPTLPRGLAQSVPPPSTATKTPLADRQREILTRVQRLESTMLKLTKLLAESEPEKAERMKDALDLAGKKQIKGRVESLVQLLQSEKLGDADTRQSALIKDLEALLQTLTNPANELDARRQEREKLEALKRSIRTLMDEQTQHMYRTQQVEKRMQEAEAAGKSAAEAGEMLDKLEEMQRQTERKTAELQREMQPKPDEQKPARPGADQMKEASEQMRDAADKMGQDKPADAKKAEEQALEKLQQALDELDDALRQVRKEEMDDTLSAIETRLRDLLSREKLVRESVRPLESKSTADFSRAEQAQVVEAATNQKKVAEDCAQVLRIVVDEGTTVIVPELLKQLSADMALAGERLDRSEADGATARLLDDIIAQLEEILAAVEKRREQNRDEENQPQPDQPQQPDQGPKPLLPTSAELKLLRSAQVRINERMPATQDAAEAQPAPTQAEIAAAPASAAAEMQRLFARQRQLVELARRMNERKQ